MGKRKKNYGLPKGTTTYEEATQRLHLDIFHKRYRLPEVLARLERMHDSWHLSPAQVDALAEHKVDMYVFSRALQEVLRELYQGTGRV
jgi:hypothetical protein